MVMPQRSGRTLDVRGEDSRCDDHQAKPAMVYPGDVFPFRTGKWRGRGSHRTSEAGAAKLIPGDRGSADAASRPCREPLLALPSEPFLELEQGQLYDPTNPAREAEVGQGDGPAVAREETRDCRDCRDSRDCRGDIPSLNQLIP